MKLDYLRAIDLRRWESGELIYEDIVYSFERLSEDILDTQIPLSEKKEALRRLQQALREFEEAGYGELFLTNPSYPPSHWWWHPELWNGDLDIYSVLEEAGR